MYLAHSRRAGSPFALRPTVVGGGGGDGGGGGGEGLGECVCERESVCVFKMTQAMSVIPHINSIYLCLSHRPPTAAPSPCIHSFIHHSKLPFTLILTLHRRKDPRRLSLVHEPPFHAFASRSKPQ